MFYLFFEKVKSFLKLLNQNLLAHITCEWAIFNRIGVPAICGIPWTYNKNWSKTKLGFQKQ